MDELQICMWRVGRGQPSGAHVWFDPNTELVRLFRRPPSDSGDAPGDSVGVAQLGEAGDLDRVGSVSECEAEAEGTNSSDDELPF